MTSSGGPSAATPDRSVLVAADSLAAAFALQVARAPQAIAVVDGELRLTYAALQQRVDCLARLLLGAGVQADTLVGIALPRGADLIVAMLAIVKAGGAYVPLDPTYPLALLAFQLADSKPAVLVTNTATRALLAAAMPLPAVIDIDTDTDRDTALVAAELLPTPATSVADAGWPHVQPQQLAYVIYTSGSTGQPKGVMVEHAQVLRLFAQTAGWFSFGAHDVWTLFHSCAFDFSVWEIWGALLHGGRLVIVPAAVARVPAAFYQLLCTERVTILNQTPSAFRQLSAAQPPGAPAHCLRTIIFGGEALPFATLAPWYAANPAAQTQLVNMYGITETTVHVTARMLTPADAGLPGPSRIGTPIADLRLYLLDADGQPVAAGATGEIHVAGAGLARGYLNRSDLTAQRFVADPFTDRPGQRMYRSGDLGRRTSDGDIEYLGRNDHQVKIRGYRIETGAIEAALMGHADVAYCTVMARDDSTGEARLVAYVVCRAAAPSTSALRHHLLASLPEFMLPAAFVFLPQLPLTRNGKLDRDALPPPPESRPLLAQPYLAPIGTTEALLCSLFGEQLDIAPVGRADNFFELGGNSLSLMRLLARIADVHGHMLAPAPVLNQPTPQALALLLDAAARTGTDQPDVAPLAPADAHTPAIAAAPAAADAAFDARAIAIVAMSGRFPGAADTDELWQRLQDGVDCITHMTPAQLDPSIPAALATAPDYVRARGLIADADCFDAAFFGISPREAEVMDPQHRLFLELCWDCLERGGYAPDATPVPVGVFGGCFTASYLQHHVQAHPNVVRQVGELAVMLGNDKDFFASRVAHRLNLRGPAVNIQTACSTSLVAIVTAVNSLRAGQCSMALAGGVAINCPPHSGYLYQEGAMLSRDGRTRSFDAAATGTVFSDGAGVVLLKRLADAVAAGDPILGVIRGVAMNNDGASRASFTAPGVDGQAAVIGAALADAGLSATDISYVEAHGTATPLGDPIELAALTQAYRLHTAARGFCRIGSVKSNLGHLTAAAGVTGVIKTALALQHAQLPATLHYDAPNPHIDFAGTPFIVNDRLHPWPRTTLPRRAGVSSFGFGGTNAHIILEEAPLLDDAAAVTDRTCDHPDADVDPRADVDVRADVDRGNGNGNAVVTMAVCAEAAAALPQLLQLSAITPAALAAATQRLAAYLERHPGLALADVAHTLRNGRKAMPQRACVVATSIGTAVARLRDSSHRMHALGASAAHTTDVLFMFPGQAAQYPAMGRALHASAPAFRDAFDACMGHLDGLLDGDLRERLFAGDPDVLSNTATTQPALFAVEYALACYWMSLGVKPRALIGHSVGEFVAATLAGVFSLADAMRLMVRRGQLMQALPPGAMLAVRLPAATLAARLPAEVCMAAENSPTATVVAGPCAAIEFLRTALTGDAIPAVLLDTSHAFHSAMMTPALASFEAAVRTCVLRAPTLPIYSTVTAALLTDAQACDPGYWARHMRCTVRFSPALLALRAAVPGVLLEIGPRATLTALARQHRASANLLPAPIASLAASADTEAEQLLLAAGRLWLAGVDVAAPVTALTTTTPMRRRVTLPGYAFARTRHWLAASPAAPSTLPIEVAVTHAVLPDRIADLTAQVRALLEDATGLELGSAADDAGFLELGLDSLALTQVAIQIRQRFKVAVTFRQLMEQHSSPARLAHHLDAQLPQPVIVAAGNATQATQAHPATPQTPTADSIPTLPAIAAAGAAATATPTNAASIAAVPALGSTRAATDAVHQVIAQQMQLMAQQLALLQGLATAPVTYLPLTTAVQTSAATNTMSATNASPAPAAPPAAPTAAPTASSADSNISTTTASVASEAAENTARYDVKKAFGAIARIYSDPSAPLSQRQQARLGAFMTRYIERTIRSKQYNQTHRAHLADPRVVNGFRPLLKEIVYQIVVDRSQGAHLFDIDGNDYVDVINGFGMSLFGWQPAFVVEAVKQQIDAGYEIGPLHPLAGEVAQLICALSGHARAALCNTGSEAVMGAMRIARTTTGRNLVVAFSGSYHGIFDEVIVRATKRQRPVPGAPGILPNTTENIIVLDYGTPESLEIIRSRADEIAAVLIEPVQSRRPDFQPREFLHALRGLCTEQGIVFILDEVITGFRCAPGGIQELFDLRADLCTYGKVIGGGFPIGVIAGTRACMDALDGGWWDYGDDSAPTVGVTYFAGTFVRHPLALAAAKASLLHLQQAGPALQQRLGALTTGMVAGLNGICRRLGAPIEVRSFASVWKIFFTEDHPLQDLLFAMLRNRGIHIIEHFPCFLTTAHTAADIARITEAFGAAVTELQDSEFLPRRVAVTTLAFDAATPPVPGARLGKDPQGNPAWFVPDAANPGKFARVLA